MQGDLPSQSKGGHKISDANEPDRQDHGGVKEKSVLSKPHRKTVKTAHQTLKGVFESKSRYLKIISVVKLICKSADMSLWRAFLPQPQTLQLKKKLSTLP